MCNPWVALSHHLSRAGKAFDLPRQADSFQQNPCPAMQALTLEKMPTTFDATPTGKRRGPLKGKALIELVSPYIGSFQGPGDLAERHSEYFAEALLKKHERRSLDHDTHR